MCNLIRLYTHERRPYSATLYPTSFAFDSLLALTISARARLTVGVPPRAPWLAGIFLRRKKGCAGVVGTRTDWVFKGEGGGITTSLLQYVARFDGGGEIVGFGGGGVTRRVGRGAPGLSDFYPYLLRQAVRN